MRERRALVGARRPRLAAFRRLSAGRLAAAALAAVTVPAVFATSLAEDDHVDPAHVAAPGAVAELRFAESATAEPATTAHDRLEDAESFVADRDGTVSFAIVSPRGEMRGRDEHALFTCASVVKSMLLAAELHRLADSGQPLDSATRSLLEQMITISDNDAATAIYARVGDEGLYRVAKDAGMEDFEVQYSWGFAKISAADMARMFARLDRVLPERYLEYGKGLLGSITPEQSWGIPAIAEPRGWSVRFKGGWLVTDAGQLVSQAAELRRPGRTLGMAVLSDGDPSMAYGIETVQGVASRLLAGGSG